MRLFWEQKQWDIEVPPHGTTPLEILSQLDANGRETFMEILFINYREETEAFRKGLYRFEKAQFGRPDPLPPSSNGTLKGQS
jgi:hypothetical protein